MSLIASGPPLVVTTPSEDPSPLGTLNAGPFWPVIDLAKLRDTVSLDGAVTAARLTHAATSALSSVVQDLATWWATQAAAGHATLADVPALAINGHSVKVGQFETAVYALTRASLLERYAGIEATGRANDGAEIRAAQANELRRDAFWAVRDIQGTARMTSELI